MVDIYGLTRGEIARLFSSWGLSPVHAGRLWNYLYLKGADSFAGMSGLPARVRARLEAAARLGVPRLARETFSADGFTRKYLLAFSSEPVAPCGTIGVALCGSTGTPRVAEAVVETVLMRYTGRVTACVSSQAGCAMGCVFCATGQMGFQRNLTAGEIVAQVAHVGRVSRVRNVVLMGMGEPLLNYDAVMRAADILRDPAGLCIGAGRITLSTVGVVPGILRLAEERQPLHLAVSLHAATQEERAALVPAAKPWPLPELMAACRVYGERTGRRIFYEWTLIEGRNDSAEQARSVGRLLKGLPAQVNLIPLNPTAGYDGKPGRSEAAKRFQAILAEEFSLPSTVRQRRGIDIAAGCGQLAGTV